MEGMTDERPETLQQPEWIAVSPPHPYSDGTARPGSKAYAILAMALGLVALLTAVISGLYSTPPAQVGWALGIAATAIGTVALVKRSRPTAAGAIGLVSGVLAIAVALYLPTLTTNTAGGEAPGGDSQAGVSDDGSAQPSETEWQPGDPQDTLVDWPANTASGSILFELSGEGDSVSISVRPSDPLASGDTPQPVEIDRDRIADVKVYVDYRCPHCLQFEENNGEFLTGLLTSAAATVELVPLTFLDRNDASAYSSRAAGLTYCVVDGQPEAAWVAHQTLLSSGVQPTGPETPSNEALLEFVDAALTASQAAELSPAVRDCVVTGRFAPFARALNDWVFLNAVPNATDESLRVQGTPLVLVNGEVYSGQPHDAQAFEAFFEQNR